MRFTALLLPQFSFRVYVLPLVSTCLLVCPFWLSLFKESTSSLTLVLQVESRVV